jgi:hypothetical protein
MSPEFQSSHSLIIPIMLALESTDVNTGQQILTILLQFDPHTVFAISP